MTLKLNFGNCKKLVPTRMFGLKFGMQGLNFDLLFDCQQIGDIYFLTFFTYMLAGVHFDFQVWNRNPDIWSKSAQNLLGNSTPFLYCNVNSYLILGFFICEVLISINSANGRYLCLVIPCVSKIVGIIVKIIHTIIFCMLYWLTWFFIYIN